MKFGKLYCTLPECVLQSVLNPVKKIKIENDITKITVMTTIFSSKFNNVTFPALQNQSNESM